MISWKAGQRRLENELNLGLSEVEVYDFFDGRLIRFYISDFRFFFEDYLRKVKLIDRAMQRLVVERSRNHKTY
jgi:hypothetical protein